MDNEYVNTNITKIAHERAATLSRWRDLKTKWGLITAGTMMFSILAAVILEFYAESNGWNDGVALIPFIAVVVVVFISSKKGVYECPFCHKPFGRYRRATDLHCTHCGEKIW